MQNPYGEPATGLLAEQEDAYADSLGQVIQNLIGIYRALGGGWAP